MDDEGTHQKNVPGISGTSREVTWVQGSELATSQTPSVAPWQDGERTVLERAIVKMQSCCDHASKQVVGCIAVSSTEPLEGATPDRHRRSGHDEILVRWHDPVCAWVLIEEGRVDSSYLRPGSGGCQAIYAKLAEYGDQVWYTGQKVSDGVRLAPPSACRRRNEHRFEHRQHGLEVSWRDHSTAHREARSIQFSLHDDPKEPVAG
jgi:hypothetical protein